MSMPVIYYFPPSFLYLFLSLLRPVCLSIFSLPLPPSYFAFFLHFCKAYMTYAIMCCGAGKGEVGHKILGLYLAWRPKENINMIIIIIIKNYT